jgi:hypothetical protein
MLVTAIFAHTSYLNLEAGDGTWDFIFEKIQ